MAGLALVTSGALTLSPVTAWHRGLSHASSPTFVVLKLGVVLCIVTLLAVTFARVHNLWAPLRILAGETLSMYAFHLIVLYWTAISVNAQIGHTLGFGPSLTIAAILIVVTTAFGLAWNKQKQLRARAKADRSGVPPTITESAS
jgi:peptidoglycan/LPS O-acetylase OafA/YrhL